MNFFRSIRENLKDPKKKALTQLAIYGVFFIFVFILIKTSPTKNYDYYDYNYGNTSESTQTKEVQNYEYSYKILNDEDIINVVGTYKDNKDTFNYNKLNYTKENGIVYFNNAPTEIDFDIEMYKYKSIEKLIENSDSKTTYKDSNKTIYNISIDKYFNLLNVENECEDSCKEIYAIITVESNDYIEHVVIDLSNYYEYLYTIDISYSNINRIA